MNLSKTIIGRDPALKSLLRSVKRVAPTDATVLITGETGTGKELIAGAILKNSSRCEKEFVPLNCAALAESLIESELFGYSKGAFTGAIADRKGILATVDGGTLFLDEINSLPLSVQVKLLRFIEAGEYLPVGSVKMHKADVRIIAASNSNLDKQVSAGRFREDLYFRLNVVPLLLPPLRERPRDIKLLIDYFFGYFANKYSVRTPSINIEALEALQRYHWPGNVRELRNLCEKLTVLRLRRTIGLNDLPREYLEIQNKAGTASLFDLPSAGVNWPELEVSLIRQAMEKTNGKYREASLLLGMSRDTLYYRTKKHGLTLK
ncbi:MAG: sigma-54 interaction domain-containing protein [Methylobacter sp.]